MPRKIEQWKTPDLKYLYLSNEVIKRLDQSNNRDLVITQCAILDVGLVHLLENRLANLPKIAERFLELADNEGPASTFSARIQLAALVGLISENGAEYLTALKNIRNKFAHRVVIDFTTDAVVKELNKLRPFWKEVMPIENWMKHPKADMAIRMFVDEGINSIGKTNEAGRTMFLYTVIIIEQRFCFTDSQNERLKTLKEIHTTCTSVI
jgi:DNA-binding MltR family transcriptional regulator